MIRLLFPIFLVAAAIVWGLVEFMIKKDKEKAKGIFSFTLFFSVIWAMIYYFIFF